MGILRGMARPNLSYLKNLLLFLFGLPLGLLTGLTGTAASVFAVPGVRSLLGLHPARAIGTSLVVTFFAALASLLSFAQHDFLRGWLALALLVGLSVGKVLGQRVGRVPALNWLWGTLLAAAGLAMIAQGLGFLPSVAGLSLLKIIAPHTFLFLVVALLLTLVLGAISHWMGLGAELLVPLEIYALGQSPHLAIGTAILVLVLASLPGVLLLLSRRQIEPQSATWLSFGGLLGGLAGAAWAVSLSNTFLVVLFGLLLAVLGVLRLWRREEVTIDAH